MNIKHVAFAALIALSCVPAVMTAEPTVQKGSQDIVSATIEEAKTFFNVHEKKRIKQLLKSLIFFGGAYRTYKFSSGMPSLYGRLGDLIAFGMGYTSLDYLLKAVNIVASDFEGPIR